jgi:hypothetical protein
VTILAPVLTYLINYFVMQYSDYKIGVELIIIDGLLTFIGLWFIREKDKFKIG